MPILSHFFIVFYLITQLFVARSTKDHWPSNPARLSFIRDFHDLSPKPLSNYQAAEPPPPQNPLCLGQGAGAGDQQEEGELGHVHQVKPLHVNIPIPPPSPHKKKSAGSGDLTDCEQVPEENVDPADQEEEAILSSQPAKKAAKGRKGKKTTPKEW